MRETARAVARTVDKELEAATTTLAALGEAEPLDASSPTSFYELCQRIVLELAGHEVHEAVDGPSGLAMALDLRPDIVLVDIGLPGFDGLEMARRVRDAVGASIHLVALTGYGQPDDRRQALGAGLDAHLVKPVHPPALLAALRA